MNRILRNARITVAPHVDPTRKWLGRIAFALFLSLPLTASAAGWWCSLLPFLPGCEVDTGGPSVEVSSFGTNPGQLKMFQYVPPNLGASRPLVVALHGCTQQATNYDDEPGWIKLADKYRFALLLPEQQFANNGRQCFNWFLPGDYIRDSGEALSIKQMIDTIKTSQNIDPTRIYVTGLSGGGGMAVVMLATYPEVFAGGGIVAGIPYQCANGATEALSQCGVSLMPGQLAPMKDLTPLQWGTLVRNASNHSGPFPRVSIWQGTADTTVNPVNERELMEQWTNVLGIDQVPDTGDTINGFEHKVYKDGSGKPLVETFLISGMAHGTPIDPGTGDDRCGKASPFILNVGICSSFHMVKFWGLTAP